MQRAVRMKKELQMVTESPPHGISCWADGDGIDRLEAKIIGGEETPYSGGVFKLEIQIPDRYPFEPPKVRFVTPIYHPNIDTGGRICLDTLKMPPKGAWKPCLNISTVLTSIQLLMAEPNPDDPLMIDIQCGGGKVAWKTDNQMERLVTRFNWSTCPRLLQSNEFKHNRAMFSQNAKKWTSQYAMQEVLTANVSVLDVDEVKEQTEGGGANAEGMKLGGQKNENMKRTAHLQDMTNKLAKWS